MTANDQVDLLVQSAGLNERTKTQGELLIKLGGMTLVDIKKGIGNDGKQWCGLHICVLDLDEFGALAQRQHWFWDTHDSRVGWLVVHSGKGTPVKKVEFKKKMTDKVKNLVIEANKVHHRLIIMSVFDEASAALKDDERRLLHLFATPCKPFISSSLRALGWRMGHSSVLHLRRNASNPDESERRCLGAVSSAEASVALLNATIQLKPSSTFTRPLEVMSHGFHKGKSIAGDFIVNFDGATLISVRALCGTKSHWRGLHIVAIDLDDNGSGLVTKTHHFVFDTHGSKRTGKALRTTTGDFSATVIPETLLLTLHTLIYGRNKPNSRIVVLGAYDSAADNLTAHERYWIRGLMCPNKSSLECEINRLNVRNGYAAAVHVATTKDGQIIRTPLGEARSSQGSLARLQRNVKI
ncbi:hypothetical protein H9P43_008557 [Blastocladiella emersonii ATCC 22665]|nr:hypothetical protein H9P43_008557 [Blastocladiella emersonii ATCC 22665]